MSNKRTINIILFIFSFSGIGSSQKLEVEGGAKVTGLTQDNSIERVVVVMDDGTLAYRDVHTINYPVNALVDGDNNRYTAIQIGSQVWMKQNLKTTSFNDGTPISEGFENQSWTNLDTPGFSWYDNDPTEIVLYNHYVTIEPNLNVCPIGWHVPTDAEWTVLVNYLGGFDVAGGKLKEAGFDNWMSPNASGTNSTGFTGLPHGYRTFLGDFLSEGELAAWWSSNVANDGINAFYRRANFDNDNLERSAENKESGFSIRCIKN